MALEAIGGKVRSEPLNRNFSYLDSRMYEVEQTVANALTKLSADETVSVGPSGDFETINDALQYLSAKYPLYKKNGYTAKIILLSGFSVKEQILVSGIDLRWIAISSEDEEVQVLSNFLTTRFGRENRYPLFGARNGAFLPIIDALFNMQTDGDPTPRDGLYLEYKSSAIVTSGHGVKNMSGYGIRGFDGCEIYARNAIFSNAGDRGCMISQGSQLIAPGIDLSHARGRNVLRVYRNSRAAVEGANLSYGGEVNVRVSEGCVVDIQGANVSYAGQVNSENEGHGLVVFGGSIVYANYANISSCAGNGIIATNNSTVSVNDGTVVNNGRTGIEAGTNSLVYAASASITGNGMYGLHARNSAVIVADYVDVRNSAGGVGVLAEKDGKVYCSSANSSGNMVGFRAYHGGKIFAESANANNCDIGLDLFGHSEISARNITATNCANKGAQVSTGSRLYATGGDFSGAGVNGIHAYRGCDVYLYGAKCRKGSENSSTDIVATTGTIVRANGAEGGFNLTPNTITNEGIIFA